MSGSGYIRQSSSSIASGKGVNSAPVNNEFNQLQAAFSGSTGHAHDGSTGNGPVLLSSTFGVTTSTAGILVALGSGGTPAGQISSVTITGTSNEITVVNGTGASGNPTISIATGYLGQSSITTLGTIATGVWNGTIVTGTYGGTGVNNGSNTITVGGNLSTASSFTTSGANPLTLTTTGTTNITLPTSGTLVSSTVTTLSSLTTVGTIGTGTWQGSLIGVTYGGTGANLSATGGTSNVLKQVSTGAAVTVGQLAASDLSNGTTGTGAVVLATVSSLTSLVNVGAISSGTWNATTIAVLHGGTGTTTSTGTGSVVLSSSPTLSSPTMTTPTLGVASATNLVVTGSTVPANGIYLPSSNVLGISTNTANIANFTTTGLAVGASAPSSGGVALFELNQNAITLFDVENSNNNSSAGVKLRLITENSGGSGTVTLDLVKLQTGAFQITNNDVAGSIALISNGNTGLSIDSSGNLTTTTQSSGDSSTKVATTSFVTTAISANSVRTVKAWANFDGTASGTIVPRASFNVASVTKNGTGSYTIAFSNAANDANYVVAGTCGSASAGSGHIGLWTDAGNATSGFNLFTGFFGTLADEKVVMVEVVGN